MRSVYLQSNKEVFDVHLLPANDYAVSLGLVQPPKIRFMKKLRHKDCDTAPESEVNSESDHEESAATPISFSSTLPEQDEEFLTVKRSIASEHCTEDDSVETLQLQRKRKSTSRISQAKKLVNKKLKLNTHIIFDEGKNDDHEEEDKDDEMAEGGIDINEAKALIKVQDRADKKREQERVKEKHKTRWLKSKVNTSRSKHVYNSPLATSI